MHRKTLITLIVIIIAFFQPNIICAQKPVTHSNEKQSIKSWYVNLIGQTGIISGSFEYIIKRRLGLEAGLGIIGVYAATNIYFPELSFGKFYPYAGVSFKYIPEICIQEACEEFSTFGYYQVGLKYKFKKGFTFSIEKAIHFDEPTLFNFGAISLGKNF